MHRFDWEDLATSELLDTLRAATGSYVSDAALRPPVAAILRNAGGLPLAKSNWSAAHRTAVGARLLREAVGAAFAHLGYTRPLPGADLGNDGILNPAVRVDANTADAPALVGLPVVGPALARRMIDERRGNGPFAGPGDLASRVRGIGPAGAARLAGLLGFSDPAAEANPSGPGTDYVSDLHHYLEHHVAGSELVRGLERLAVLTAAHPHPATRQSFRRAELDPAAPVLPDFAPPAKVEILEDDAYLSHLLDLLSGAQFRIDAAMFYMSTGGNGHPNESVIAALSDAKDRGVAVRVLLDRDQPDDPYGSEIINSAAAQRLTDAGVSVRLDARERLLHSKALAVDGKRLLIGSHNWTRASYETYGDVSAVLHSPVLAAAWHARFDALWDAAHGD